MQFLIAMHKNDNSIYEATVPDLPGCFSAGDTIEEAILHVQDAIECYIEELFLNNKQIPIKKPMEKHFNDPDFKEGIFTTVDVDITKFYR